MSLFALHDMLHRRAIPIAIGGTADIGRRTTVSGNDVNDAEPTFWPTNSIKFLILTQRKKRYHKIVNIQKLVWVFNALVADPLNL
jgi:hypothetical protein